MPRHPLNEKLRALRTSHWPGRRVLQSRVADALGVTGPSISAYENDTVPPPERLDAYALFFATPRWLEPTSPRRVSLDFLDEDERETYEALRTELQNAAATPDTTAPADDFWTFPPDEAIRVLCGELKLDGSGPYADPAEPNYMWARRAADLDSLIEMWGHLRARNPTNNIRLRLGADFNADDLNAHLVILGNIA
ncbi:MAG: helix-turn-helix domain-containing protein, partial [Pseudonocardia sp.]|nr:helix-turn-helix domain-containing protein [Pseudonocardia sp.]